MENALLTRIIKQEKQLLGRKLSLDALNHLIDDECMKMGANGHLQNKTDIIRAIKLENTQSREGMQFKTNPISKDIVLLTYICSTKDCEKTIEIAACASVWREKNSEWNLVFHQETPMN